MKRWVILALGMLCIFTLQPHARCVERQKPPVNSSSTPVIMGWQAWPPFTYRDAEGALTGLNIEIVSEALKQAAHTLRYREVPWARCLQWLKQGEVHIAAGAMKTPERDSFAYFSTPISKESYILFVRKDDAVQWDIDCLEDLIATDFRLGVLRGSVYGDDYMRLLENPEFRRHVEPVREDEQNFKKLLLGRIDGFILEASRMRATGEAAGILDHVEPLLVLNENYLHVMFSKKATSPDLVQAFNAALRKMRETGAYQALFEKYGLSEFNMLGPSE